MLAQQRADILGIKNIDFIQANAENLNFDDNYFDHINCQGVIHHTPNTESAAKEIARTLKSGGTFSISVYYKNIFLRSWPWLRRLGTILSKFGGGLKGRGREGIFELRDVSEVVRFYDGSDNPIGKAYSKAQFLDLLPSSLNVARTFLHFFPLRALPFSKVTPPSIHKMLDKEFGFLIYATGTKV